MPQTDLNPEFSVNNTRAFPSLTQPKIVGSFSVDADRRYIPTGDNLKYLSLPKPGPTGRIHLDLNEGFEVRQPKPASAKDEQIDHLLRFIVDNLNRGLRERDPEADRTLGTDFVCFRGLLRMVMCTPYERRTGWIILATRYRGTVYLCAKDTPEKIREEASQTEQQKRFCYYGFKFEQHVLSDEPDQKPDTSAPVIESEEFCAMFSATLEGNRVLYGAEMDGVFRTDPLDKRHLMDAALLNRLEFVEVKVKRRESNQRQVDNFYRFKTRNWWCQSFLVNIGRIFVGLRDDRGVVDEIREMGLKELDRDSRQYWSASVCMAFCSQFLAMVKDTMAGVDCKGTVYRFEYDANRCRNVTYQVFEGPNEESFLPGWYCSEVK
ncbi:hypothetical protein quinque_004887 [Culex quinquefasciatus]|uniref:Decapping nuclease n=3 Tax=Culex pipiens TaxID=7175 RepID=A0A8D8K2R1_CULPI